MDIKQKWILLYSRPYRVVDEKSGQVNEGISIRYITSEDLAPYVDGDEKGLKTAKDSVPLSLAEKIKDVPGIYDFTVSFKVGADGKSTMKVKDLAFSSVVSVLT